MYYQTLVIVDRSISIPSKIITVTVAKQIYFIKNKNKNCDIEKFGVVGGR